MMNRTIPMRESLEVEFKSDKRKLDDGNIIDAVVAFANTNGGEIYLGVENDGSFPLQDISLSLIHI